MDDTRILPARRKVDVDAYHLMAEAGVFGHEKRIELIEGDVIDMAPIGQEHEGIVARLNELLVLACAGRAIVSPQNSVRLDRMSEPQPDLAVLRRRSDYYTTGQRASPADVLLLIEVADSSLRYDRTVKLALYARSGIREYWIVDVKKHSITVHRLPEASTYRDITSHEFGEALTLSLMPEIVITLDRVFG